MTVMAQQPVPGRDGPQAERALEPGEALRRYFDALLGEFGRQGWWPARTRLEVVVGAILTQHTAWKNALLALRKLRRAGLLIWPGLRAATLEELEACVRPAGFFKQKARTIRAFAEWLDGEFEGSLDSLFAQPGEAVRARLLMLKGLGEETADAILLYAGKKPFFVADGYARRILARHECIPSGAGYAETQAFLHRHLPADHALFNEFHALLVETGKRYCRAAQARCAGCPLEPFLPGPSAHALEAFRPQTAAANSSPSIEVG